MRTLRVAVLVVVLGVLQVAFFTHARLFGVVPDLGLLLAVAIAYRYGPEAGALTGFASGLLFDLFLETPLALSALTYALTAYAVGLIQAGMLREPRGITPVIGLLAGLAGGFVFAGLGILFGVDALRDTRTFQVIFVSAVYDALLAPAVFWLVNRFTLPERDAPSAYRVRP